MAKYEARCVHHRRAIIKGDLECEDVLCSCEFFTTRKAANLYLAKKEADAKRQGLETIMELVNRGERESRLTIFTGQSWVHENTGERHNEYYNYKVTKK